MTGQIKLWLPFTRLTLSYEEIWVSPKMSVLSSETLCQTPDFRHGKSIALSTKLVVVDAGSSIIIF